MMLVSHHQKQGFVLLPCRHSRQPGRNSSPMTTLIVHVLVINMLSSERIGSYAYQPLPFIFSVQKTPITTRPQNHHHYYSASNTRLFQAKRPPSRKNNEERYYYDDNIGDDYDDTEEEETLQPQKTKFSSTTTTSGGAKEVTSSSKSKPSIANDFRRMGETSNDPIERYYSNNGNDNDQYFYDEDDDEDDNYETDNSNRGEGYYSGGDEDDIDDDEAGNFWSNPLARYDPIQPATKPPRRVPLPSEPAPMRQRSPTPRRTTNGRGLKPNDSRPRPRTGTGPRRYVCMFEWLLVHHRHICGRTGTGISKHR